MALILDLKKGFIEEENPDSNRVVLHDSNTVELKLNSDHDESVMFNVDDVKSTAVISDKTNYSNIFWLIISILVGLIVWRLIDNEVWAWLSSGIIWVLSIYFFIDKLVINKNVALVFNLTANTDYHVTLTGNQSKNDALSFVEAIHKRKSLGSANRSNSDLRNAVKHKNRYSNQVYTIGD